MRSGENVPYSFELLKPAVTIPIDKKARATRCKRGQMTFLTPEETLGVLKAAREHSTRDWAMILLAYRHGLRASEVCGLKLADIDLKVWFDLDSAIQGLDANSAAALPPPRPAVAR